MKEDIDNKFYNYYINGDKQAFEYLYNKYKDKIKYFIFNIVKDYHKAEDLTQETFIYILQNRKQENSSFKYYIYLVARSKALDYTKTEKRRNEINTKYISIDSDEVDKDVAELIIQKEEKKELLSAIGELEEKYKNAIYLTSIEGLSYEETANILGITIQNTKTLIHRGKKQLRRNMIKKGFEEMNRTLKILILIISIAIILTGLTYAGNVIYNKYIKKQEEINSRGLFDIGDGITTYETSLMENNMIYNEKTRLYYKIIENNKEYQTYKTRITELPSIEEVDFDNNFFIIIANENMRPIDEKDLTISDIVADENTTYIKMQQKENPNYEKENNIWYAIVDKSLLRGNIDIFIKSTKTWESDKLEKFEKIIMPSGDYGIDQAIEDGCIVLETNEIKSNNKELLDEFANGNKDFIRVYNKDSDGETYIEDVLYIDKKY